MPSVPSQSNRPASQTPPAVATAQGPSPVRRIGETWLRSHNAPNVQQGLLTEEDEPSPGPGQQLRTIRLWIRPETATQEHPTQEETSPTAGPDEECPSPPTWQEVGRIETTYIHWANLPGVHDAPMAQVLKGIPELADIGSWMEQLRFHRYQDAYWRHLVFIRHVAVAPSVRGNALAHQLMVRAVQATPVDLRRGDQVLIKAKAQPNPYVEPGKQAEDLSRPAWKKRQQRLQHELDRWGFCRMPHPLNHTKAGGWGLPSAFYWTPIDCTLDVWPHGRPAEELLPTREEPRHRAPLDLTQPRRTAWVPPTMLTSVALPPQAALAPAPREDEPVPPPSPSPTARPRRKAWRPPG